MNKQELIKKITQKKEFSQLPKKDVLMAFEKFDNSKYSDEEKIKLTRNLLRNIFSSFTSIKLLSKNTKKFDAEKVLRKHTSTRERLDYYPEIYERILRGLDKKISIIDLGAGVNAFSYNYLKERRFDTEISCKPPPLGSEQLQSNCPEILENQRFSGTVKNNVLEVSGSETSNKPRPKGRGKTQKVSDVNYIAIEGIGQLVELTKDYFKKDKIEGYAFHLSLFELKKIKDIIKKQKKPQIVFLLKILDSLELLKRDYSKKILIELLPLCERAVVSFATKSMGKKQNFKAKRTWIVNFIKENFKVLEDFEVGGERYLVFSKK